MFVDLAFSKTFIKITKNKKIVDNYVFVYLLNDTYVEEL